MAYYTIQQMECFFTIVECGSMSRAAEQMFVTQPSLSKTLRRLEDGLGFPLFVRDANKLQLTKEGEFLYLRAKPLYQRMNVLINTLQNMSRGQTMLRIGYFFGNNTPLLQKNIQRFKQMHPEIDVLENAMDRRALRDGLSTGTLDVIFSLSYAVKKIVDSKMKTVERTKLYLVMRNDNPMARSGKIDTQLLQETTMFFCTNIDTQTFERNDMKRCREIGFQPKKTVYLENYESCLRAVEKGEGVCMAACGESRNGLTSIEIPWIKNTPDIVAVWLEHNSNAALREFLTLFPDLGTEAI